MSNFNANFVKYYYRINFLMALNTVQSVAIAQWHFY
ncbi:MAG: hypothetical protein ACI9LM_004896, partial [Alteromonadaceae bacterium]